MSFIAGKIARMTPLFKRIPGGVADFVAKVALWRFETRRRPPRLHGRASQMKAAPSDCRDQKTCQELVAVPGAEIVRVAPPKSRGSPRTRGHLMRDELEKRSLDLHPVPTHRSAKPAGRFQIQNRRRGNWQLAREPRHHVGYSLRSDIPLERSARRMTCCLPTQQSCYSERTQSNCRC